MPHALFLGSHLATQDRISSPAPSSPTIPLPVGSTSAPHHNRRKERLRAYIRSLFTISRSERIAANKAHRNQFVRPETNSLEFIHAHLTHGIVDIVTSLLGVAVPINSA